MATQMQTHATAHGAAAVEKGDAVPTREENEEDVEERVEEEIL